MTHVQGMSDDLASVIGRRKYPDFLAALIPCPVTLIQRSLLLFALPWMRWGSSTDPNFVAGWWVVLAVMLALQFVRVKRPLDRRERPHWIIWSVFLVVASIFLERMPTQEGWHWVLVLAVWFNPSIWRYQQTEEETSAKGVWERIAVVWAMIGPVVAQLVHTKGWIPSVELLCDVHALALIGIVAKRPKWRTLLLVFAPVAWELSARTAVLVVGLAWLIFFLSDRGWLSLFKARMTSLGMSVLALLFLVLAPMFQRTFSYDLALEEARKKGMPQALPEPGVAVDDAWISGSLAERVTQWAWTVPKLSWAPHGPGTWKRDVFYELTWYGPPNRRARRPHNVWLHGMYEGGIAVMVIWMLWAWLMPLSALITLPLFFLGFPSERPDIMLAISILPAALEELHAGGESKASGSWVWIRWPSIAFWVLALVRWSQIGISLGVQGDMQRAVRSRQDLPALSSREERAISLFRTDLQGNDVALFQAMDRANQGRPCQGLELIHARQEHGARPVPHIRQALMLECQAIKDKSTHSPQEPARGH